MKSLIKKILREQHKTGGNPRGGTKQNAGAYIGVAFEDLKKLNKYREDQLLSGEILTKLPDEVDITKDSVSGQILSVDDVLPTTRQDDKPPVLPPGDDYDPPMSEPPLTRYRVGCTDPTALNYDPVALQDDGSCEYPQNKRYGCTDPTALNYDPTATFDDGSCLHGDPPGEPDVERPIVFEPRCFSSSDYNIPDMMENIQRTKSILLEQPTGWVLPPGCMIMASAGCPPCNPNTGGPYPPHNAYGNPCGDPFNPPLIPSMADTNVPPMYTAEGFLFNGWQGHANLFATIPPNADGLTIQDYMAFGHSIDGALSIWFAGMLGLHGPGYPGSWNVHGNDPNYSSITDILQNHPWFQTNFPNGLQSPGYQPQIGPGYGGPCVGFDVGTWQSLSTTQKQGLMQQNYNVYVPSMSYQTGVTQLTGWHGNNGCAVAPLTCLIPGTPPPPPPPPPPTPTGTTTTTTNPFHVEPDLTGDTGSSDPVEPWLYDDAVLTTDPTLPTNPVNGCMDPLALNYNPSANTDDGSCVAPNWCCTWSWNCDNGGLYDPNATPINQCQPSGTGFYPNVPVTGGGTPGCWQFNTSTGMWETILLDPTSSAGQMTLYDANNPHPQYGDLTDPNNSMMSATSLFNWNGSYWVPTLNIPQGPTYSNQSAQPGYGLTVNVNYWGAGGTAGCLTPPTTGPGQPTAGTTGS